MINISINSELSLYNLEGKWNDYIGVQKEVIGILKKENFFDESIIVNQNTGMVIIINAKDIKETIGSKRRFQSLPKKLKVHKVVTIRYLKQIIENAKLISDNVENLHEEKGYCFAYFENEVCIDGEIVGVRISVMKKIESNWFWIHHIDEKEKSSKLLDPSK